MAFKKYTGDKMKSPMKQNSLYNAQGHLIVDPKFISWSKGNTFKTLRNIALGDDPNTPNVKEHDSGYWEKSVKTRPKIMNRYKRARMKDYVEEGIENTRKNKSTENTRKNRGDIFN